MKFGISLPVREMKDDLGAIRAYAELADELGLSHLRVPDTIINKNSAWSGYMAPDINIHSYHTIRTRYISFSIITIHK